MCCLWMFDTLRNLVDLTEAGINLNILCVSNVSQEEKTSMQKAMACSSRPVLALNCTQICNICLSDLHKNEIPCMALANGLWLSDVPPVLQNLSWVECHLISRVVFNYCVVQVQKSGLHKLHANAISHALPTQKIHRVLPSRCDKLDNVLAIIYIDPVASDLEKFKHTPFPVNRNKVAAALKWLKINHSDYADLTIFFENLNKYPEDIPPVIVDFCPSNKKDNKDPEATGVNKADLDISTSTGQILLVVHSLTGKQLSQWYDNKNYKEICAVAAKHFKYGGHALIIGHNHHSESLYNNLSLYSSMFPWLFLYSYEDLGNSCIRIKISDAAWKHNLLM